MSMNIYAMMIKYLPYTFTEIAEFSKIIKLINELRTFTQNCVTSYPTKMMMNEAKLRTRKMKTEYSHPGSFCVETINGRQTPSSKNRSNGICLLKKIIEFKMLDSFRV